MLVFQAPYDQIHTRKSFKKNLEKDMKKNHQCCSKVPEKLSKWRPKINLKSMEIRLWIPGCPFCCSYGLPGLPQGAKVVPKGAKMEPPSLPTGSFGHQKLPRPLRKSQLFENSDLETNIQKSASQHTFQQINLAELKSNSKNPTSQQAIKPIRILQSQQASKPARSCQQRGPAAGAKP